jgi:hypothetical protein
MRGLMICLLALVIASCNKDDSKVVVEEPNKRTPINDGSPTEKDKEKDDDDTKVIADRVYSCHLPNIDICLELDIRSVGIDDIENECKESFLGNWIDGKCPTQDQAVPNHCLVTEDGQDDKIQIYYYLPSYNEASAKESCESESEGKFI